MKLSKKKVFALALAVCLIATLSVGTLAWFTDNDSVTNDFLIAGSDDEQNADKVFSVDVWEKDDPNSDEKLDKIEYPAILPGDDLYKEVNIENTGSYDQYVRATVTVSDAHIWQEIYGVVYVELSDIATNLNTNYDVYSVVYDVEADTLTYVLYYNPILRVGTSSTVFTNIHIPEDLDRFQAAEMAGGFVINVYAEAVQTENVGDSAVEAFETVGMAVEEGNRTIISDTTVNNNGAGNYAYILLDTTTTVFEDVHIDAVGGIQAAYGAQVEFNSGSIKLNSTNTAQRHIFYAASQGTKVVVNGGTFSFEEYRQRSYACAVNGGLIEIYGGTFGVAPNHPRWTTPIYEAGGEVIIYGGTFGFDPTEWVADGYVAVENNGVWTVSAQ